MMSSENAIDFSNMLLQAKRHSREERRRLRRNQQQEQQQEQQEQQETHHATSQNHPRSSIRNGTTMSDVRRVRFNVSPSSVHEYEHDHDTKSNITPTSSNQQSPPPDDDESICCCHTSILHNDRRTLLQQHRLSPNIHPHTSHTNTSKQRPELNHVYYIPQCLTPEFIQSLQSWLTALPHYYKGPSSSSSIDPHNGKWTHLRHARRNVAVFNLTTNNQNLDAADTTTLSPSTTPPQLQTLCDLLLSIHAFPSSHPPNHVLINEYQPSEGIMPHTDGPVYLNRTATFSIGGGDVIFKLNPLSSNGTIDGSNGVEGGREGEGTTTAGSIPVVSEDGGGGMEVKLSGLGSLIVFTDDAYTQYRHSIDDRVDSGVEIASERCVNSSLSSSVLSSSCGAASGCGGRQGEEVRRGYRISLTFRHQYL